MKKKIRYKAMQNQNGVLMILENRKKTARFQVGLQRFFLVTYSTL